MIARAEPALSGPTPHPWGRRLFRVLLLLTGGALAANAIWMAAVANLTTGTALVAGLALGLLAWGIWYPRLQQTWLKVVAGLGLLAVLAMAGFLYQYGTRDTITCTEPAVIVLGAAVHGDQVSPTLARRLEQAVKYHACNPGALIVVSGGQGPQENRPEGEAMRDYLLTRGIPDANLVAETRATSTAENFANSAQLLTGRVDTRQPLAFITDEFHVFRASQIATAQGLDTTHLASRTTWYFAPANYLRETLAVVTNLASGLIGEG